MRKTNNESLNPSDQNDTPLTGVSILLVEDNDVNILVATKFLKKWGASVDTARNGMEAIEVFNDGKHHLILMDMHMPVLDGLDATIRLRERGTTVPIIALTASIVPEEHNHLKVNGITDIIIKPFEPNSFLETIQRCIANSGSKTM